MLGFPNLFAAMFLRDSMKPQATTKQIQNTKLVIKFHPLDYIEQHGIHTKASNLRLVLKCFETG